MKKVTAISYVDLNSPKTPKGPNFYQICKKLEKENLLERVLVRGNAAKDLQKYVHTPIPLGNYIPKVFTFINHYFTSTFPHRKLSTNLFDSLSSRQLGNAPLLYCGMPGFIKTIKKARKKGMTVITVATVPHTNWTRKVLREEKKLLNIDIKIPTDTRYEKSFEIADYVFARSELVKESLIENGISAEKIRIIGNGINVNKYIPNTSKKQEKFTVLFLASISIRKGLQYLLEAWSKLNLPNAKLIIAGRIHDEVKPIVEKHKNLQNVKYIGHVNPLTYYQKAHIYVLPSLAEGTPKSVLEAMACELPVIAFKNTAALARDKKDGFILDNRDVEGLKQKIKFFYDNPKKRKEIGKQARKQAKNYSHEKYAEKVVNKIKEVAEIEVKKHDKKT